MSAMEDLDRWFSEVPRPDQLDWDLLEAELGFVFPADFKAYCDRFPIGQINYIHILHPGRESKKPTFAYGSELLEFFFGLRIPAAGRLDLLPDVRDLVCWGEMNGEVLFCWDRTIRARPDEWPTVVFDERGEPVRLGANMTTCIHDLITGRVELPWTGPNFSRGDIFMGVGMPGRRYPARL